MKKLLIIIFTTTLLFAQAGNDRSAEFFSNWYDTILGLEDTTVTGASNQWIQDGRGNRTGISVSDDGKTGFGTLTPDKLIGLGDGADEYSMSVYDSKFTIWNDAGVPLAIFTINSLGDAVFTGAVSGTNFSMPSFSVYQIDAGQTGIPNGSDTKLIWGVEEWDTHNDFANSTFTPSVAGKYMLTGGVWLSVGFIETGELLSVIIYKNGAAYKEASMVYSSYGNYEGPRLAVLVDANGTTDYFDMYIFQMTGGTRSTANSGDVFHDVSVYNYFQGYGIP